MAAAIRVVTVQRGIDPRGLTLIAFGGAGPMHAVRLAEMFGITLGGGAARRGSRFRRRSRRAPTSTSSSSRHASSTSPTPTYTWSSKLRSPSLADQARAELADEPGTAFEVTRSADVRYRGQAYHLTLPVPEPPIDPDDVVALATSFRERFEDSYGIALDLPTQIHNLRVHVVRVVEKFAPRARALTNGNASAARVGDRDVVFPSSGTAPIVTALYDRTKLTPGDHFEGPAVIAAPESTIVVPPRTRAEIDAYGTVVLTL